jgi:hypothetical protein
MSRVDPHPIRDWFQTWVFITVVLPSFALASVIVILLEGREEGLERVNEFLGVPDDA